MRISVIVPAFNEEKLLGQCLECVRTASSAFADRGWESECVVCDNNSTDRTAEIARAAGARVAFEPVNQISRSRNCGAAAATGDWLIFVDADSSPSAALFADVADTIQAGRAIGGGATVRMVPVLRRTDVAGAVWNGISRALRWMAGSFIFCEAAAFRELGGFSKELFASEEIDFSRRLKRLARERDRKVIILHRHPLATSGRKVHLCSPREYGQLLYQLIRTRGANLRRREACANWYDGRR